MSTPIIRPEIEALRERIRRLEGAAARRRLVLPFGIKEIDRYLPEGGLALGALHEVAGGGHGAINGAAAALFTAGVAARTRGKGLMVRHAPGPVRPGPRASRTRSRSRDLCRGGRREVGPHLFRGRLAARRPRRCRSRSRAALHDGLSPPSTCRRRLGHPRSRHPPLAAVGRGGRFRPADGIHHPLADHRPPRNPVAGAWRWTPPVASRIDPVPRW
jgi:hypothetical protein